MYDNSELTRSCLAVRPAFVPIGTKRKVGTPLRRLAHDGAGFLDGTDALGHLHDALIVNMKDDPVPVGFKVQHGMGQDVPGCGLRYVFTGLPPNVSCTMSCPLATGAMYPMPSLPKRFVTVLGER